MKGISLHIGLNRVDPRAYGGWSGQLYGCHNDALAMGYLAQKAGFTTSYDLLDNLATIKGVLDAIHVLATDTQPGDTVMITYSGHGGQVPDYSGDERDKLDETWVLYNGMLVDDDLHRAIAEFKKGVRVIMVSDSCHSGTVAKVAMFEFDDLIKSAKAAPPSACRVAALSSSPLELSLLKRAKIKASMVLLSGCQDNQFSWDGEVNGKFTEQLLQVYQAGRYQGAYAEFRKAIVKTMPPDQTPQLLVMGGANRAFVRGQVFSCS